MEMLRRGTRCEARRVDGWLTRGRLVTYSCAALVLYVVILAAWASTSHGFHEAAVKRPGVDFSVFWAASHVMLHGAAWQVYDHLAFAKAEVALFDFFNSGNYMLWLYPPTFLLAVTPLALLPFPIAYFLFVAGSVALFTHSVLRVSGLAQWVRGARVGALVVTALPCVFVDAVMGQNALLTAALAALAVYWIDRKPWLAGLCIGALAIKPQMALLFPFVLVAVRAWRVLAVAAISAAAFALVSVLVCGTDTLHMFLVNTTIGREFLLEHGELFWFASPTLFAALRINDVPLLPAYIAQAAVAALAIAAACQVWRNTEDVRLRVAIFAVATLIANPYLWHYELTWLGVALACVMALGLGGGWLRGEQPILALAWILPLYEYFNRVMNFPQVGPVILLLVMSLILRRARAASGDTL
ncbi:glycosyltransferase family 87 protein [Trinickia sp. YCB016]